MFSENLRETFNLALFWEYRQILLAGLAFNFYVFACSAVVSVALGFLAALGRVNPLRPLRWLGAIHVETFRNAPDYVMLVWVHFVLPLLLSQVLGQRITFAPFVSAVIALGLVYSGYLAETFRAGIQAVPKGHIEAARACGMGGPLIMRRIVLPQAVRMMLPEAMNNFVSLFKATTIVSLITVPDMMYNVSMVTQQEMRPLPLYTGAAITYFLLIWAVAGLARLASERWRRKIWA
ncbi:amino acid ABC transporter permease [Stella sp.]|uniref:amino acid ABC transporter permease n=1 Tax=Stella sp. TaxID=2912054 RepID=UPI0035B2BEEB